MHFKSSETFGLVDLAPEAFLNDEGIQAKGLRCGDSG